MFPLEDGDDDGDSVSATDMRLFGEHLTQEPGIQRVSERGRNQPAATDEGQRPEQGAEGERTSGATSGATLLTVTVVDSDALPPSSSVTVTVTA